MDSAGEVFMKIYTDEQIRDIYKRIDEREEDNEDAWGHHNFNHVSNVKNLVVEILKKLNANEELIEEAKIAAIMHDVGAVQGKQNHAYRSYEFAKNYFECNNIKLKDNDLILEAIKNHSDGFDTDNIIQSALILADKLDIKNTRPTKNGLNVPGNRQYKNIEDIHVDIEDNTLKIKFEANDKLNKEELDNFYFMQKVSNSIKSFAKKFDLNHEVYLNNDIWKELL